MEVWLKINDCCIDDLLDFFLLDLQFDKIGSYKEKLKLYLMNWKFKLN